ncbi:excalibur calcium-binding domain-containing protein [Rhodococcus sp. MALMAid1271]|uniref:excalibur calcium-binding domain-containing protein n=1 Tax=Rhodococcus sp. MALMAid1271 TaxID=3411744 RepID=UPI003BA2F6BF
MKTRNLLAKVGISGAIAAAALTVAPGVASADPITDFLCSAGSAQFCVLPPPPPAPLAVPAPAPQPQGAPAPAPRQGGAFEYKNCDAARAAGAAPVYRGDYGYGPHLDRDNDGIGCE